MRIAEQLVHFIVLLKIKEFLLLTCSCKNYSCKMLSEHLESPGVNDAI